MTAPQNVLWPPVVVKPLLNNEADKVHSVLHRHIQKL
jgi:hypothetical protein